MTLSNPKQLQATREKLELLERRIAEIREEPDRRGPNDELTVRSLKRLANQLKEEIVRCETRSLSADNSSSAP